MLRRTDSIRRTTNRDKPQQERRSIVHHQCSRHKVARSSISISKCRNFKHNSMSP